MLSAEQGRSFRAPRSLRAEYEEFIEQRIEEYKDGLPRASILGIGDEAVQELARTEQYTLTEVLLQEQVDSIIRRRLRLPSYRRWRERHLALRAAQVQPTHWGLAPHDPVVLLAEFVREQDTFAVVGAADGACALFLAARGAKVLVGDPDLAAIEGLENRAIAEQLSSRIECLVVPLESWTPHEPLVGCVIETSALAGLSALERAELIRRLKAVTVPGGRHVVMPAGGPAGKTPPVSSDALRSLYADWTVARAKDPGAAPRRTRNVGFLAIQPEQPAQPEVRQSETA
ncbi:MAG: hypothetical protein ABSG61_07750 [Gemmatimonadales bacterium]